MKPSTTLLLSLCCAGLALALPAASANTPRPKRTVIAVPKIKRKPMPVSANRCRDLRTRVIDWAAWNVSNELYGYGGWYGLDEGAVGTTAKEARGAGQSSSPGHYTGTNVQERGVDESDLVKTDGKYVYTVNQGKLVIIKTWPITEMKVVARVDLGAGATASQLLLNGDRLVVFANIYEQLEKPDQTKQRALRIHYGYDNGTYFHGTRIAVFDIEDRSEPSLLNQVDLEGWMGQARLIGNDLYMTSNGNVRIPDEILDAARAYGKELPKRPNDYDWNEMQKLRELAYGKLRTYLRKKFHKAKLDSAMPRMRTLSGAKMGSLSSMYTCSSIHVPEGGSQLGVLSLTHLNLTRPERIDNVGVFASGWQVYASTDAVYVAMPQYGYNYFWRSAETGEQEPNTTQVHKFTLDGLLGAPRYAASGKVRGHLLNQFSMSEHDGYLRVATTDQSWWNGSRDQPGGNNLYVLRQRGGKLRVVGKIEGLAKGERVYSARMMGDVGYVVTFRQTDPLFTLDLSDPTEPRVVGELKINGFSSYIHPIGNGRLLTIGQDADDEGRTLGAHLQIFDVSDPKNPTRIHHERLNVTGRSHSSAQWDHHAFTYDPVTRTLALPVQTYNSDWSQNWNGLIVYTIDDDKGFVERGRVDHSDLVAAATEQRTCKDYDRYGYDWRCAPNAYHWMGNITRTIVVDDYLVTLSQLGIQVNDAASPDKTIDSQLLAKNL